MAQLTCLSFHIHYSREPDALLLQVKELVDLLQRQAVAAHYFFIRYGEGGPHIRLRVFIHPGRSGEAVALLHGFADGNPLVSAIREAAYIPETERYGGPACIHQAEQLFYISSRAVLCYLAERKDAQRINRNGMAIGLHLLFLRAMACPATEMREVLASFARQWLPMVYRSPQLSDAAARQLIAVFDERFLLQQHSLTTVVESLLEQEQAQVFDDPVLEDFYQGSRRFAESFARKEQSVRTGIYGSFMHMTNNRLGIPNYDEPFIAYLLFKTLSSTRYA